LPPVKRLDEAEASIIIPCFYGAFDSHDV